MDTKLRKSKAVISFICLLFSASILLGSSLIGVGIAMNYDDIKSGIADAAEMDYQNMNVFRSIMSEYLYQTAESVLLEESLKDPEKALEERAQAYNYETTEALLSDNGYDNVDEWVQYRYSKSFFAEIQNDTAKNLLYQAGMVSNPRAYTNYEGSRNLFEGELPEGYNFRMIFDGQKVTVEKDGKQQNIYGDGFYRSDNSRKMWYVPGYENIPNNIDSNIRICLLARTVPAEPINGYSRLYGIADTRERMCQLLLGWAVLGAAGLLALIPAFGWRRHRKNMAEAIGHWTGRILFEVKLAGAFLLLVLNILLLTEMDAELILFFGLPALAIWMLYINDIRWNHKFWTNNLFRYFSEKRREKERMLPVQQRLTRRLARFCRIETIILLTGAFLCLLSGPGTILFGPATLGLMWYYSVQYKKEYQYVTGDIGRLIDQIAEVKEGDMAPPLVLPMDADMREAAENLNEIRAGVETAVEERLRSERLKIELITNVSHDIKTPLTSIISYVNLLRQEEDLPDYVKDYISVLEEKSNRLKNMVQDIFEVSKAASGNMEMHVEQLDLSKLLRQTLADMGEQIEASELLFKVEIPEHAVFISADGQRLYRVFQNLINNALLYSMEGTRVFITLSVSQDTAAASIKNVSRYELNHPEELTERFVRGDAARTTAGSGLGLSIAKNFTEACGGTFSVLADADLFTARVGFPILPYSEIFAENKPETSALGENVETEEAKSE